MSSGTPAVVHWRIRALVRFALGLVVLGGLVSPGGFPGRPAWGQDDWDAGAKAAQPPAANRPGMGRMELPDFDQWVCSGKTQDQIEHALQTLLAVRIGSVANTCHLTDAQRRKRELAGLGDVKRLWDSAEQLREAFRQVGQDQQKFSKVASQVGPLQMKLQSGDFGESTLYHKVLTRTLDREQLARYQQQEQERRRFRYEAKIELAVTMLETTMPLRAEQRQQFVKLLLDETEPPKKFGPHDYLVVFYRARKLEEKRLKPIFDDAQWQTLQKMLDQAQAMEGFLESQGFLP